MPPIPDEGGQVAIESGAYHPRHPVTAVQGFAYFLAFDIDSRRVQYISENCSEMLGRSLEAVLASDLHDLLGSTIWHEISGVAHAIDDVNAPIPIGTYPINGSPFEIGVLRAGDFIGLEFEAAGAQELRTVDAFKSFRFMSRQIRGCADMRSLAQKSAEMLRHVSGYDSVLVHRFDAAFYGEVLAESCRRGAEHPRALPSWLEEDRMALAKVPLSLLQDTAQRPVPVIPRRDSLTPLDLTNATCRGASDVLLAHLRRHGIRSAMMLPILQNSRLWGVISLQHRCPRSLAPQAREMLASFAEIFAYKLQTLLQHAR